MPSKAKALLQAHKSKLLQERQQKNEKDKDLNEWLSGFENPHHFEKSNNGGQGLRRKAQFLETAQHEQEDFRDGQHERGRGGGRGGNRARGRGGGRGGNRSDAYQQRGRHNNADGNDRQQFPGHSNTYNNRGPRPNHRHQNQQGNSLQARFMKSKKPKSNYERKRDSNPYSKVGNETFSHALENINSKRKRGENAEEEQKYDEYTNFGLQESEKIEKVAKKRKLNEGDAEEAQEQDSRRYNDRYTHIDSEFDPEEFDAVVEPAEYENNFINSLFTSNPELTKHNLITLPSKSGSGLSHTTWTFPQEFNNYDTIYFDGDALVSMSARQFTKHSYPIFEHAVVSALQEWMDKHHRNQDRIVFRCSVMAVSALVVSKFPSKFTKHNAVVGSSRLDINGNYEVPFYRANDFLHRELKTSHIAFLASSLRRGDFSTVQISDKNEKRLILLLSRLKDLPDLSKVPQASECMLDFSDSIMFYDATNVMKQSHFVKDILPSELQAWIVINLIRFFGKKYKVKKSIVVMDFNPFPELKNPYAKDSAMEYVFADETTKADELIIEESKKYVDAKETLILVTNDTELCWRGSKLTECRVGTWQQAALSAFHFKFENHLDLMHKACWDVLLWYLQQDETMPNGEWGFHRMGEVADRHWMFKQIEEALENVENESSSW